MTPADKQRLKDAFQTAINNAPAPDAVIEGMVDMEGKAMTLRKLFTATANSEGFYQSMDQAIAQGQTTVDKLVDQISKTTGISMRPNKGPKN